MERILLQDSAWFNQSNSLKPGKKTEAVAQTFFASFYADNTAKGFPFSPQALKSVIVLFKEKLEIFLRDEEIADFEEPIDFIMMNPEQNSSEQEIKQDSSVKIQEKQNLSQENREWKEKDFLFVLEFLHFFIFNHEKTRTLIMNSIEVSKLSSSMEAQSSNLFKIFIFDLCFHFLSQMGNRELSRTKRTQCSFLQKQISYKISTWLTREVSLNDLNVVLHNNFLFNLSKISEEMGTVETTPIANAKSAITSRNTTDFCLTLDSLFYIAFYLLKRLKKSQKLENSAPWIESVSNFESELFKTVFTVFKSFNQFEKNLCYTKLFPFFFSKAEESVRSKRLRIFWEYVHKLHTESAVSTDIAVKSEALTLLHQFFPLFYVFNERNSNLKIQQEDEANKAKHGRVSKKKAQAQAHFDKKNKTKQLKEAEENARKLIENENVTEFSKDVKVYFDLRENENFWKMVLCGISYGFQHAIFKRCLNIIEYILEVSASINENVSYTFGNITYFAWKKCPNLNIINQQINTWKMLLLLFNSFDAHSTHLFEPIWFKFLEEGVPVRENSKTSFSFGVAFVWFDTLFDLLRKHQNIAFPRLGLTSLFEMDFEKKNDPNYFSPEFLSKTLMDVLQDHKLFCKNDRLAPRMTRFYGSILKNIESVPKRCQIVRTIIAQMATMPSISQTLMVNMLQTIRDLPHDLFVSPNDKKCVFDGHADEVIENLAEVMNAHILVETSWLMMRLNSLVLEIIVRHVPFSALSGEGNQRNVVLKILECSADAVLFKESVQQLLFAWISKDRVPMLEFLTQEIDSIFGLKNSLAKKVKTEVQLDTEGARNVFESSAEKSAIQNLAKLFVVVYPQLESISELQVILKPIIDVLPTLFYNSSVSHAHELKICYFLQWAITYFGREVSGNVFKGFYSSLIHPVLSDILSLIESEIFDPLCGLKQNSNFFFQTSSNSSKSGSFLVSFTNESIERFELCSETLFSLKSIFDNSESFKQFIIKLCLNSVSILMNKFPNEEEEAILTNSHPDKIRNSLSEIDAKKLLVATYILPLLNQRKALLVLDSIANMIIVGSYTLSTERIMELITIVSSFQDNSCFDFGKLKNQQIKNLVDFSFTDMIQKVTKKNFCTKWSILNKLYNIVFCPKLENLAKSEQVVVIEDSLLENLFQNAFESLQLASSDSLFPQIGCMQSLYPAICSRGLYFSVSDLPKFENFVFELLNTPERHPQVQRNLRSQMFFIISELLLCRESFIRKLTPNMLNQIKKEEEDENEEEEEEFLMETTQNQTNNVATDDDEEEGNTGNYLNDKIFEKWFKLSKKHHYRVLLPLTISLCSIVLENDPKFDNSFKLSAIDPLIRCLLFIQEVYEDMEFEECAIALFDTVYCLKSLENNPNFEEWNKSRDNPLHTLESKNSKSLDFNVLPPGMKLSKFIRAIIYHSILKIDLTKSDSEIYKNNLSFFQEFIKQIFSCSMNQRALSEKLMMPGSGGHFRRLTIWKLLIILAPKIVKLSISDSNALQNLTNFLLKSCFTALRQNIFVTVRQLEESFVTKLAIDLMRHLLLPQGKEIDNFDKSMNIISGFLTKLTFCLMNSESESTPFVSSLVTIGGNILLYNAIDLMNSEKSKKIDENAENLMMNSYKSLFDALSAHLTSSRHSVRISAQILFFEIVKTVLSEKERKIPEQNEKKVIRKSKGKKEIVEKVENTENIPKEIERIEFNSKIVKHLREHLQTSHMKNILHFTSRSEGIQKWYERAKNETIFDYVWWSNPIFVLQNTLKYEGDSFLDDYIPQYLFSIIDGDAANSNFFKFLENFRNLIISLANESVFCFGFPKHPSNFNVVYSIPKTFFFEIEKDSSKEISKLYDQNCLSIEQVLKFFNKGKLKETAEKAKIQEEKEIFEKRFYQSTSRKGKTPKKEENRSENAEIESSPDQDSDEPDNSSNQINFQRKITPWSDIDFEDEINLNEVSNSRKQKISSRKQSLIVVASFVDKIPNLAGLTRTSEIFQAEKLVIPDLKVIEDVEFRAVSVTSYLWMDFEEVKPENLPKWLKQKQNEGYSLIGIEQTSSSVSIEDFEFPEKSVIVLGKEREGIPTELIHILDECVEIPQLGMTRSLNVHVSASIAIFEYTKQQILKKKSL